MRYRFLGSSGLLISRITLGTMTFGAPDWRCDEQEAHAILKRFLDGGGNSIDAADVYAGGRAEEITGTFLPQIPRKQVVLASKGYFPMGTQPNHYGLSRKHIIALCEVIPAAADHGLGILCYGALGAGLLTGKYKGMTEPPKGSRMQRRMQVDGARFWHPRGLKVAQVVEEVSAKTGIPMGKLAIAWPLRRHPLHSRLRHRPVGAVHLALHRFKRGQSAQPAFEGGARAVGHRSIHHETLDDQGRNLRQPLDDRFQADAVGRAVDRREGGFITRVQLHDGHVQPGQRRPDHQAGSRLIPRDRPRRRELTGP